MLTIWNRNWEREIQTEEPEGEEDDDARPRVIPNDGSWVIVSRGVSMVVRNTSDLLALYLMVMKSVLILILILILVLVLVLVLVFFFFARLRWVRRRRRIARGVPIDRRRRRRGRRSRGRCTRGVIWFWFCHSSKRKKEEWVRNSRGKLKFEP